jgi:hypothetical protein
VKVFLWEKAFIKIDLTIKKSICYYFCSERKKFAMWKKTISAKTKAFHQLFAWLILELQTFFIIWH